MVYTIVMMKVLVNSDDSIQVDQSLRDFVDQTVQSALGQFGEHITRVEVHLSDENKQKHGAEHKRCMMEARIQGRQPNVVTHYAETTQIAVTESSNKLHRSLEKIFSQLRDHRS